MKKNSYLILLFSLFTISIYPLQAANEKNKKKKSTLFVCQECHTGFTTKRSLKNCEKKHLKDKKKFPCYKCEERFFSRDDLMLHFRTHIPIKNVSESSNDKNEKKFTDRDNKSVQKAPQKSTPAKDPQKHLANTSTSNKPSLADSSSKKRTSMSYLSDDDDSSADSDSDLSTDHNITNSAKQALISNKEKSTNSQLSSDSDSDINADLNTKNNKKRKSRYDYMKTPYYTPPMSSEQARPLSSNASNDAISNFSSMNQNSSNQSNSPSIIQPATTKDSTPEIIHNPRFFSKNALNSQASFLPPNKTKDITASLPPLHPRTKTCKNKCKKPLSVRNSVSKKITKISNKRFETEQNPIIRHFSKAPNSSTLDNSTQNSNIQQTPTQRITGTKRSRPSQSTNKSDLETRERKRLKKTKDSSVPKSLDKPTQLQSSDIGSIIEKQKAIDTLALLSKNLQTMQNANQSASTSNTNTSSSKHARDQLVSCTSTPDPSLNSSEYAKSGLINLEDIGPISLLNEYTPSKPPRLPQFVKPCNGDRANIDDKHTQQQRNIKQRQSPINAPSLSSNQIANPNMRMSSMFAHENINTGLLQNGCNSTLLVSSRINHPPITSNSIPSLTSHGQQFPIYNDNNQIFRLRNAQNNAYAAGYNVSNFHNMHRRTTTSHPCSGNGRSNEHNGFIGDFHKNLIILLSNKFLK